MAYTSATKRRPTGGKGKSSSDATTRRRAANELNTSLSRGKLLFVTLWLFLIGGVLAALVMGLRSARPSEPEDQAIQAVPGQAIQAAPAAVPPPEDTAVKGTTGECIDHNDQCSEWASVGQCHRNPAYMHAACAKSCGRCLGSTVDDAAGGVGGGGGLAVGAGKLEGIFQRALADFSELQPTLLSSDPWVLQFDAFASEAETEALIRLGEELGFEPSQLEEGSSRVEAWRTSSSTTCVGCHSRPDVQQVFTRASNVTTVPLKNFEHAQLLKYTDGQYYKSHLDYISEHAQSSNGPRIFSLLLYLNDLTADAAGATVFKYAGKDRKPLAVQPQRGRAILWPNVLDERPLDRDERMFHLSLPLRPGHTKYAMNQWIRQRRYSPRAP